MRYLLLLIALPFVVYGGLWGYLYYQTKSVVDQMIAQAGPLAQVKYGGIAVSLFESHVGVRDLVVSSPAMGSDVRAEAVLYDPPDLSTLLSTKKIVESGKPPPALSMQVRGLVMDWGMFEDAGNPMGDAASPFAAVIGDGCVGGKAIKQVDLRSMGFSTPVVDFNLGYVLDASIGVVTLDFRMDMRNIQSFIGSMQMEMDPSEVAMMAMTGQAPVMRYASLTLRDDGYQAAANQLCASRAGIEAAAYVEQRILAGLAMAKDSGITADDAVIAGFRQFVEGGGDLTLVMEPFNPVDVSKLHLYKPEDALRMVRPRLDVNGAPLDLAAITQVPSGVTESLAAMPAAPTAQPAAPAGTDPAAADPAEPATPVPAAAVVDAKPARPRQEFRATAVTDLGNYIGHQMKLTTMDGREFSGVLLALDEKGLRIERRLSGGKAVFPFNPDDLRSVEVLR